jgi:dienelactone hydrolase
VQGQDIPVERLRAAVQSVKDLEFPDKPSSLGMLSIPGMALYKPEGSGPFPAIVLLHQCGGLRSPDGKRSNTSMLDWARVAVARGYAVLLVDSLSSRGVDMVCMGPKNGVTVSRGVRDAFQALEYLRKLDFVDKERVVLAGYSWGAMVGTLASGRAYGAALGEGHRYRAVTAFYPGCFTVTLPNGRPFDMVPPDIDRPLLVLMGDQDTETPPAECLQRLEPQKARGAPIEWHVYAGATHCWDCAWLDGLRKVDFRGNSVVYRYDKAMTQDAERRMFAFFESVLGKVKP